MRLVEVAKKLGMTGQELRRELSQVDFGVKPTDREVPDQLAQGILRFMANKHGITIELDMPEEKEATPNKDERDVVVAPEKEEEEQEQQEQTKPTEDKAEDKKVHVLRKLTLDGVSAEAVAAQKSRAPARPRKRVLSKAEREKKLEEQKVQRQLQRRKKSMQHQEQIKKKEGVVELPDVISVKEFAEKTGVQVAEVVSVLMKNGVMATITQNIDFESAAIVAAEVGVQVKKVESAASAEELIAGNLEQLLKEDDASTLKVRPPVVTVMGHVDHGKTALLDALRKTDVVSGEAGGITQHIGASTVEHEGKSVTFLDTPGHEAFTAMRARGAQITDIVVLVVAADEGVKPTTIEAIDHAKDAGVPILVAINKADKPNADPDRVKGELAGHDLQPEDWGGKTPTVLCSAKTGQGISDVIDHVVLLAEMAELKANPDRRAVATVIEAHLDSSLGPVGTVVINTGTLRTGDAFVCGESYGKIKSMTDSHGKRVDDVGPSGAVRIAGFSAVPESGDILQVATDEKDAKRLLAQLQEAREARKKRGLGDLLTRISAGKMTQLKLVLKADTQGSLEAVSAAVKKLEAEGKVIPKIIHGAVGAITEGDVMMAAASDGVVIGFNVDCPVRTERLATENGVQVKQYDVIYTLLEDVSALLKGLIEPEEEERITGHLEVLGTFFRKGSDQTIGGKVTDGLFKRVPFRIQRDGEVIGEGRITSLKKVEKDVKEVKEGSECGMKIDCDQTIEIGDILEGYVKEWKKK